jgi:shikimate dehydrogenase
MGLLKRLAVIGYPIGHSMSPVLYNTAFAALSIDAMYEAWSVPPDDLPGTIERLRAGDMLGMNVTVPHKQAVMPLLDEVDEVASEIGAVNCISKADDGRLIGHNTDMYGFMRSLIEAGCEPDGLLVVILGAGGGTRSVATGLIKSGVAAIGIAARDRERAQDLAAVLRRSAPDRTSIGAVGWQDESFAEACLSADLIVNCTPVGMWHSRTDGESPVMRELLHPGLWVYDLVYNPTETRLLAFAREAGARPIGGLNMLIYQAAESLRYYTGLVAPVDLMREAAKLRLEEQE